MSDGQLQGPGRQAPVASMVGGLSGVAPAQSQVRWPQCSRQPAGPGPSSAGGQDAPRNDFLAPPAPEVREGNGHPWPDAWRWSRCEAHCLRLELGGPGPRGLQEAPEMPSVPLPTDPEPEQEPERADPAAPSRMKALAALLLALLLCGQPGTTARGTPAARGDSTVWAHGDPWDTQPGGRTQHGEQGG